MDLMLEPESYQDILDALLLQVQRELAMHFVDPGA